MPIHPNNCLWLVDQNGYVICYNLESKQFESLPNKSDQEILFKSLASSKNHLYAVSCDHRLFIYVFSATNKIVENFEFWENERWNFISGFTHKLLPTDRPVYSNFEGTQSTPKESFKLPSDSWQWSDQDWTIDEWQYAPDFSMSNQFTFQKTMISMVRKRRWHRKAYFAKFDEWIEIESILDDKYQDPILDVAIGGQDAAKDANSMHKNDVLQRDRNQLAVWVITISSKIYFRQNVYSLRPEGERWIEVSSNEVLNSSSDSNSESEQENLQEEISKLSVGSSGNCWCLTSCGRCLVRLVTKDNLIGTCWQLVSPPFGSELVQLSVGQDSVWAIDKRNELWFRKGIRSSHSSVNLMCAIGSGWMKLSNGFESSCISVNPFDQCWAISLDKRKLYFRMGIEPGMLSGKLWKLIARIQDTDSSTSRENDSELGSLNDLTIKSDISSNSNDYISTSSSIAYLANQTANSWRYLSASTCLVINDSFFKTNNYLFQKKNGNSMYKVESINEDLTNGSIDSGSSTLMDNNWKNSIVTQLVDRFETEMSPFKGKYSKAIENGTWLKSASVMYMSNEHKIQHLSNLDLNSGTSLPSNVLSHVNSYLYSTNIGGTYEKSDFIRAHLELDRDGDFSRTESGTLTFRFAKSETKRGKIAYNTNVVNLAEIICITSSSNIINFPYQNILFIYLAKHMFIFAFEDEKELNDWFATLNVACNCLNGLTETVFSPIFKPIIFLISLFGQAYAGYLLSDRSIQLKSNRLKSKLETNHQSQRNLKYKIHKFKEQPEFQTDEDGETEQSIEQILNKLKDEEIQLHKMLEDILMKSSHCSDQNDRIYFMHVGGGNFKQIEFAATGVVWALSENGSALVHNNQIGGTIYKNLLPNNNLNFITDTQTYTIYENQRWLPIQGFTSQLLPTDRPAWSDDDGLIELKKDAIKLPSSEWRWCEKEWEYVCDSKTDADGWMYSIDFSSLPFHADKKISDLVRRRRWCRLAKLETLGPWNHLQDESPICLKSIAMYEANFDDDENKKSQIILWAVSFDGDALVRIGVSKENPLGDKWQYVSCREKLVSVSISGSRNQDDYFVQVWAVGQDGLAYLRHDVTFENPGGVLWFTVESPNNSPISKLMACPSNCFMLDHKSNFYFRDKIKATFPEGIAWLKLKDTKFKILHASFPSNDSNKFFAVIEFVDKQHRKIVLVLCQNFSSQYNLTVDYEFKWKAYISAFKFVTC